MAVQEVGSVVPLHEQFDRGGTEKVACRTLGNAQAKVKTVLKDFTISDGKINLGPGSKNKLLL